MDRLRIRVSRNNIDIAAIWQAVKRERRRLFGVIVSSAVLSFIVLSLIPPKYTSEARILINDNDTASQRPVLAEPEIKRAQIDTEVILGQIEILTSRELAENVIDGLDLEKNQDFTPTRTSRLMNFLHVALDASRSQQLTERERVLRTFKNRLFVGQIADSRVILVRFTSYDRKLAARIANALAKAYIERQKDAKRELTRGTRDWLNKQIDELREKIKNAEQVAEGYRLRITLQDRFGGQEGRETAVLNDRQLSELNRQFILAKAQRTEAEARARLINDMLKNKGDITAASEVLRSPFRRSLVDRQVQLQRTLAELSEIFFPAHPQMQQLNAELKELKTQIRKEMRKIVIGLANDVKIFAAREKSLKLSLQKQQKNAAQTTDSSVKLRAIEAETRATRELLSSYIVRSRDARARHNSIFITTTTIISKAYPSSRPSFPQKGPMILLTMLAVALIFLASILARELLAQSLNSAKRARKSSTAENQTIMKRLKMSPPPEVKVESEEQEPSLKMKAQKKNITMNAQTGDDPLSLSAITERLVEKMTIGKGYRTLITADEEDISSSIEAIEIARQVAAKGKQVILVDTYCGSFDLTKGLDFPRFPGLRELIAGQSTFENVVHRDLQSAAHIIPSGDPEFILDEAEGLANLIWIFDALDQIYDVVMVHVEKNTVEELYEELNHEFQSMIVVEQEKSDGIPPRPTSLDFIGLQESGLEIFSYKHRSEGPIQSLSQIMFEPKTSQRRIPKTLNVI